MKTIRFFRIMILVAIMFVNANCKKENPFANATSGVVVPPPTINTSPKANAALTNRLFFQLTPAF